MNENSEAPLRCSTRDGREWQVEVRATLHEKHGRQQQVHVLERNGTTGETRDVPLALKLGSRIRYGWLGTWPPERATRLYADGDCVVLEYRDEWIPFERPILPFEYDRESEWHARYDPRRKVWSLKRVRQLDYELTDAP